MKYILLLLLLFSNLKIFSQNSSNFDVYVEIIEPISVYKVHNMNFGKISIYGNGGDLSMYPDGNVILSGQILSIDELLRH